MHVHFLSIATKKRQAFSVKFKGKNEKETTSLPLSLNFLIPPLQTKSLHLSSLLIQTETSRNFSKVNLQKNPFFLSTIIPLFTTTMSFLFVTKLQLSVCNSQDQIVKLNITQLVKVLKRANRNGKTQKSLCKILERKLQILARHLQFKNL